MAVLMSEYHKIETLFDRDNNFAVIPGRLRLPEFAIPQVWLVTEKIDGTNVRVIYRAHSGEDNLGRVTFGGKTDDAQMPTFLLTMLQDTFTCDKLAAIFKPKETNELVEVVLYGEGYGPKIQKGGNYRSDVSFRLFDVKVGEWWLNWSNVKDVATKLDIMTVPDWGDKTIEEVVSAVRGRLLSTVADEERGAEFLAEGVVCRTNPLLFTRKGERLMWKLKAKDFVGKKRG